MALVKQMAAFTAEQAAWLQAEAGRLNVKPAEVLRRVVDRVRLGNTDPMGAPPDRSRADWWQAVMLRRRELGMTLADLDSCIHALTGKRVAPAAYSPADLVNVYYGMAEWYAGQAGQTLGLHVFIDRPADYAPAAPLGEGA